MTIEQKAVNTLRVLSVEAIEAANSGHPGLPMGAAPMAYTLWKRVMKHNPKNPEWFNRDRFVLSAGHGSALLYSLLNLFDYGLSVEDLKEFRQLGSKTPGHPEYGDTVGVEATTGPLGQGIAMATGMAMAEAHLAAKFNREDARIVDHYTYVLSGDGCLMEGINYEAASLAGSLGLDKLILLYDSNSITIEGGTDLAFTENVGERFAAMGWHVQKVEDGNDLDAIERALEEAKASKGQPSIIEVITEIGYGAPAIQGKSKAHGSPLGEENIREMKENLGWEEEASFTVAEDLRDYMASRLEELSGLEEEWAADFRLYEEKYPELAEEFRAWMDLELPMDYLNSKDYYDFDKDYATRASSGLVINRLAERIPNLIGGSADLAPSNKTNMDAREDFSRENYLGSNIHFGIREHAMGAILNGMALHGGLRVFGGTFLVFSDYMKPAMRLSALMGLPVTYVLTHDSIGVGEDGPTHQPVDQLAMLRSIPNFTCFRPADARETAAGWKLAMLKKDGPVGLALSRQGLANIEGSGEEALKGGYILKKEEQELEIILLASGSEVNIAYDAAKILEEKGRGTRVVSMPSMEIFQEQDRAYREEVLPGSIRKRLAVEAAYTGDWYRYVGLDGDVIGMESFGASGPGGQLFEKFGFTVNNIVERALNL